MRLIGTLLMALGVLVGIAAAAFVVTGGSVFGLTWLVSVAVAKLTFLSSLGLMGAGAVVHRLENRRNARRLPPGTGESEHP